MNEDTRGCGLAALLGVVVLVALLLLGWATSWFGLVTERPMQKYAEETRAQVYDQSRAYQQGTNRDIARYCEQMRAADTAAGKRAVAALIRTTAATYNGPLEPDNEVCLSEARGN